MGKCNNDIIEKAVVIVNTDWLMICMYISKVYLRDHSIGDNHMLWINNISVAKNCSLFSVCVCVVVVCDNVSDKNWLWKKKKDADEQFSQTTFVSFVRLWRNFGETQQFEKPVVIVRKKTDWRYVVICMYLYLGYIRDHHSIAKRLFDSSSHDVFFFFANQTKNPLVLKCTSESKKNKKSKKNNMMHIGFTLTKESKIL